MKRMASSRVATFARNRPRTAEVTEVTERHDDGRMDIVVTGAEPFRVHDRFEAPDWPAGRIARIEAQTGGPEVAEELGAALQQLAERLPGRDLVVAGMGVTTDDDDWREELLRGWLDQVSGARSDGIAVRGAFIDGAIDGYDGRRGFDGLRGLAGRDRRPKPSAEWLRDNRPRQDLPR